MRNVVPPHIAWPLFVILLLLIGVGSAFAALWAARSDGGVEAVEDYYQQAIRWDEEASLQSESARLGWSLSASVVPSAQPDLSTVHLVVVDSLQQPVTGLRGTLRLSRPQSVHAVAELPLSEADEAGHYRQQAPITAAGLWDFTVRAQKDSTRFSSTVRLDLP